MTGKGGGASDGSVRVEPHGLTTLVLLNGWRLPNSGIGADASVDLNTLPLLWIDRVEVLGRGASAIYGADAVSGVVNSSDRKVGADQRRFRGGAGAHRRNYSAAGRYCRGLRAGLSGITVIMRVHSAFASG